MRRRDIPEILSIQSGNSWRWRGPSIWALDGSTSAQETARSIARTLLDQPPWLEPAYLYDEKGSRLFKRISSLPEYYLTRTEEAILAKGAKGLIAAAPVHSIVELGAGYSEKTPHLLREQTRQRGTGSYIAVDVSESALRASRKMVRREFPSMTFHGLCSPYEAAMTSIKPNFPTLFLFLGSTIGNFYRTDFDRFLQRLSHCMGPDDFFLLGVDRVKEAHIIERAYDDSRQVTAEFILNVFNNINRLAGTNFDPGRMRYQSCYNEGWQQVEMNAISTCSQDIRFPSLGTSFRWREGNRILVEISRKFDPLHLQKKLQCFHLKLLHKLTDPKKWFSLMLFRKRS